MQLHHQCANSCVAPAVEAANTRSVEGMFVCFLMQPQASPREQLASKARWIEEGLVPVAHAIAPTLYTLSCVSSRPRCIARMYCLSSCSCSAVTAAELSLRLSKA